MVCFYFDPSPRIWLNALGISAIIGFALMLSVSAPPGSRKDPWQTFRLFMMPFGVSSFSQLIKGQGFFLVVPPRWSEAATGLMAILIFVGLVMLLKVLSRRSVG